MWLYVPYQSAQDTQELNSESPQWQMLSRSATSKETWRKPLSWYRAFGRDSYLKLLSGVILKPSTLSRGVAEWISSLEVSHVSHSVSQDKNGKPTTSEIYGPTLLDSQGNLGTQLSFAKTYPAFFDTTGTLSNQSFKQWATALRKDSTQRLKQALRTEGSDYSLWPTVTQDSATMRDKPYAQGGTSLTLEAANWRTPSASDGEGGVMEIRPGTTGHYKLRDDVANWPTPTAGHPSNTNSKRGADTLYGVTENWMTPNTMDALPPKSQEALDHEHETARPGRATPNNLRDQASVQAGMTFWPTPNTMDTLPPREPVAFAEANRTRGGRKNREALSNLREAVQSPHYNQNWPTPATRDHKGFDSPGKQNAHQDPEMYHSIRPDQPIETDGHTCSTKCRRLNPLFAEWLMGIPQNWTALEDYGVSATESYPLWRLSLGATLQRSCASLAH